MRWSVVLACLAVPVLLAVLRIDRRSIGLPIAYLLGLLLIHVPGAVAQIENPGQYANDDWVATGIKFTTIGAWAFVAGASLLRLVASRLRPAPTAVPVPQDRRNFWKFCLIGGWAVQYIVVPLLDVPSIGAAFAQAAPVWMAGVMFALRFALYHARPIMFGRWCMALLVFPFFTLVNAGFISYGATAVTEVLSGLTITGKRYWRVMAAIIVASSVGMSLFAIYFQHRNSIRAVIWSQSTFEQRLDAVATMFAESGQAQPVEDVRAMAMSERLNQNVFVGLAARRLEDGEVDYLRGRSLVEAMQALVPRIVWPEKPVAAGSPRIVSEMTGLTLNENTSFGVGNVMEFYVNFGHIGLIGGFFLLGACLAFLDRAAAVAEESGDLRGVFKHFLVGVALIQPNGSIVELAAGSASAWVAAMGWSLLWNWHQHRTSSSPT